MARQVIQEKLKAGSYQVDLLEIFESYDGVCKTLKLTGLYLLGGSIFLEATVQSVVEGPFNDLSYF